MPDRQKGKEGNEAGEYNGTQREDMEIVKMRVGERRETVLA